MTKPIRESRETIEAELQMGERARVVVEKALSMIRELDEFEARLQAMENEASLPVFYRSKPLTERIAHLGMSPEAIAHTAELLDGIEKLALGRGELSDVVKRQLGQEAEAARSAADQLARIIKTRQKPGP
jgi:hypothetical protein